MKNELEVRVVKLNSLQDYKEITPEQEFNDLINASRVLGNKKIAFISSTAHGGGVALMRHAIIRLFRLLAIDAHWYVLEPDEEVFKITKNKFHNVLQNIATPDIRLNKSDKKKYEKWIGKNAKILNNVFKNADVIVIDDPQPSGLIPYIKKINNDAKIVFRSHIHLDAKMANKKGTNQSVTWKFIWNFVKNSDEFVFHPVKKFVPKEIPRDKLHFWGASTDPLDGLNKELTKKEMEQSEKDVNEMLAKMNQEPIDFNRKYIIQIARFDPSKGISDCLFAYDLLVKKLRKEKIEPPQLVITGNSSIDDPDGIPVFDYTIELLNSVKFLAIKKDVRVIRLPHNDELLNTLLRKAYIGLQLSHREGFEVKVTEGLMKGIPMVVYKTGGIPLQIKDKKDGFLVKTGDHKKVADYLYLLFTNKKRYRQMSENAKKYYSRDALTIKNATNWLRLVHELTS